MLQNSYRQLSRPDHFIMDNGISSNQGLEG